MGRADVRWEQGTKLVDGREWRWEDDTKKYELENMKHRH